MNKKTLIVALAVLLLLSLSAGCNLAEELEEALPDRIAGSGTMIEETREVSDFDALLVSGFGTVNITQGDTESLTITTDDNLMEYIRVQVVNGTLELGFTEEMEEKIPDPTDGITFNLGVVDLNSITLRGAASIESDSLTAEDLTVTLDGAGSFELADINAENMTVESNGAGSMTLSGITDSLEISLSGVGGVDAGDLQSNNAVVTVSGLGGVTVWAVDTLDANITGAGGIDYYGSPTVTENITGLGNLSRKGEK